MSARNDYLLGTDVLGLSMGPPRTSVQQRTMGRTARSAAAAAAASAGTMKTGAGTGGEGVVQRGGGAPVDSAAVIARRKAANARRLSEAAAKATASAKRALTAGQKLLVVAKDRGALAKANAAIAAGNKAQESVKRAKTVVLGTDGDSSPFGDPMDRYSGGMTISDDEFIRIVTGLSQDDYAAALAATDAEGALAALEKASKASFKKMDEEKKQAALDVVTIAPNAASIPVGSQQTLTALVNGVAIPDAAWVSSDPSKATVDAKGVVTAVAPGAVQITASKSSRSASATVTVTDAGGMPPIDTSATSPGGGGGGGGGGEGEAGGEEPEDPNAARSFANLTDETPPPFSDIPDETQYEETAENTFDAFAALDAQRGGAVRPDDTGGDFAADAGTGEEGGGVGFPETPTEDAIEGMLREVGAVVATPVAPVPVQSSFLMKMNEEDRNICRGGSIVGLIVGTLAGACFWRSHRVLGGLLGCFVGTPIGMALGVSIARRRQAERGK